MRKYSIDIQLKIVYNITGIEVWLSLVEYYVRDVGAAGSNPVTSTKNGGISSVCGIPFF